MKEFVNDIQNLIVKHWGKLIITTIIVTLLINYKDVSNGFMDGFRDSMLDDIHISELHDFLKPDLIFQNINLTKSIAGMMYMRFIKCKLTSI